jgi:hypothetical protein
VKRLGGGGQELAFEITSIVMNGRNIGKGMAMLNNGQSLSGLAQLSSSTERFELLIYFAQRDPIAIGAFNGSLI